MSMPVSVDSPSLGPGVLIDVDKLIESRLLVQANSGAGKSWVLRRLLEQTYGRCQHLVIDVEGEFHTLREKFDYVLAGPRGSDCPATVRCAALLARRLLELGASAIVDICELGVQRSRFVARFLNALVSAPSVLWRPALVVVDEAQLFAAEGVQPLPIDEDKPRTEARDRSECAGAVIDLMSLGRKRGLAGVLATQRLAKLHKDAAAEAINKLIGRTTLDIDRRRAGTELGFGSRDLEQLRKLRAGEFFAFGPALTEEVTLVRVGPVATTHPQAGQRSVAPTPPRAKIREVLSRLADLPAEAETEARTIDELRARVVDLERSLASRTAATVEPQVVERLVLQDAQVARLEAATRAALKALNDAVGAVGALGGPLAETLAALRLAETSTEDVPPAIEGADGTASGEARDPAGSSSVGAADERDHLFRTERLLEVGAADERESSHLSRTEHRLLEVGAADERESSHLSRTERRLLEALAWSESLLGLEAPSVEAVAFLAGYRPSGGSFNNLRGRLRSRGFVVYPSPGFMSLTDVGRAHAPWPTLPPRDEERRAMVLERLSGPERRLLEVLLAVYPEPLSIAELAARAGYGVGSGSFNNLRGRLRTLGLVEYPWPRHARAADSLFSGRVV